MTGLGHRTGGLVALLAFCVAIPVAAQEQHPNQSRGLNGTFSANGIDNVSLFNGALQLTIPLSSYPVGGDFSYGLVLSYNSNLWDYETVWNPQELEFQTEAEPHETFTAGFGWTLTLGKLLPPFSPENPSERYVYLSQDGGGHSFYQAQHEDIPDNDPATLYTRDGSFLRMKVISSVERHLETPDGGLHKFI